MYDWLIRSLSEEVNGETGELLLHPYYPKDDPKCSGSTPKDYELEVIKKEGDVWYFPKKLATNPAFRRWKARKQLEVTFKSKFIH